MDPMTNGHDEGPGIIIMINAQGQYMIRTRSIRTQWCEFTEIEHPFSGLHAPCLTIVYHDRENTPDHVHTALEPMKVCVDFVEVDLASGWTNV